MVLSVRGMIVGSDPVYSESTVGEDHAQRRVAESPSKASVTSVRQGLELVHFSEQRKHLLRDTPVGFSVFVSFSDQKHPRLM